jgi:hypothetical protein
MKKREFWQIEPVQVDRESAFKRQPNLISGCFKRIMKVVLFTCLFIGLGFFYLINWGFDEVVESSARHHSGTAYFYAPWTYEGSIALWIYDGRAPVETVISLGKVHERFFEENRVSLDSAYWSQDESIIIVDVAADRRTRPDGKKPLTGYDFDQHKIHWPQRQFFADRPIPQDIRKLPDARLSRKLESSTPAWSRMSAVVHLW